MYPRPEERFPVPREEKPVAVLISCMNLTKNRRSVGIEPKMMINHISVNTQVFNLYIVYVRSEVWRIDAIAMVLFIPAIPALFLSEMLGKQCSNDHEAQTPEKTTHINPPPIIRQRPTLVLSFIDWSRPIMYMGYAARKKSANAPIPVFVSS